MVDRGFNPWITLRESAENLAMAARLARDLPRFVRTPLTVDASRRLILHRLAHREQRFLALADRSIYGHPGSPYRKLLVHAGCERGDLHALVAREGIEGALRRLADEGVYVTFDELKGRRPAVRGSASFTFTDRDFDNPDARQHYVVYTGGTTGRPVRVGRTLHQLAEGASLFALTLDAHGVHNPTNLLYVTSPLTWLFIHLKLGQPVDGWFYAAPSLPLLATLGTAYVRQLLRLAGRHLPQPERCDLLEPEKIVRWLIQHARPEQPVVMYTTTSAAVRVALAATAMEHSLRDVVFHARSEPLSEARRRAIDASGARVVQNYASVEMSFVGYSCPDGAAPDDLHVSTDRYAVTERTRPIFENGPPVDALLLTTLSPNAPKVGFNLELGDAAHIEVRDCGCSVGALGLRTHISDIRSFEKLSSEGTSFLRGDVLRILEEVLPTRFGGTALDYQLVEEEAADGMNRLILRIHPGAGEIDADAVRAALIAALGSGSVMDEYQAHLIRRAQNVEVKRLVPLATSAGKVLPFHLVRLMRAPV